MTARDYVRSVSPEVCYLKTFNGYKRVDYINADWHAHCPEDNAGFGFTYTITPDTILYSRDEVTNFIREEVRTSLLEGAMRH